jgi:hypothetical protein
MYKKLVLRSAANDHEIVIHSIFGRAVAISLIEHDEYGTQVTRLHGFRRRAVFMKMLSELIEEANTRGEDESLPLPPAQPWPWAPPKAEQLGYSYLGDTNDN